MDDSSRLSALIRMSRVLGEPARGYVILAEGNTSARDAGDCFWVKASGYCLDGIDETGFVRVGIGPLYRDLGLDLDDLGVAQALQTAKVDASAPRPSVETFLHAIAIREGGAEYVGHTHPVAVNRVLCSRLAADAVQGRLFPDEIVGCGPRSLCLPYCDPGLTLAHSFRRALLQFMDSEGQSPKVVLVQNHGLIVLGRRPEEVLATTAMTVKAFEVLWGTYALGGPHFLSAQQVARIQGRPDEHYRRQLINKQD